MYKSYKDFVLTKAEPKQLTESLSDRLGPGVYKVTVKSCRQVRDNVWVTVENDLGSQLDFSIKIWEKPGWTTREIYFFVKECLGVTKITEDFDFRRLNGTSAELEVRWSNGVAAMLVNPEEYWLVKLPENELVVGSWKTLKEAKSELYQGNYVRAKLVPFRWRSLSEQHTDYNRGFAGSGRAG